MVDHLWIKCSDWMNNSVLILWYFHYSGIVGNQSWPESVHFLTLPTILSFCVSSSFPWSFPSRDFIPPLDFDTISRTRTTDCVHTLERLWHVSKKCAFGSLTHRTVLELFPSNSNSSRTVLLIQFLFLFFSITVAVDVHWKNLKVTFDTFDTLDCNKVIRIHDQGKELFQKIAYLGTLILLFLVHSVGHELFLPMLCCVFVSLSLELLLLLLNCSKFLIRIKSIQMSKLFNFTKKKCNHKFKSLIHLLWSSLCHSRF